MAEPFQPEWRGDVLIVKCARCASNRRVGSEYADGSGVCRGCRGAGWYVLSHGQPNVAAPRDSQLERNPDA